jgi:DNA mismatch repair protein MutS
MQNKKNIKLTPMMKQYFEIKKEQPDCILFFRMGDFYEMFDEDAKIASKILGIALTARNKSNENPIPMCGIPYHSYKTYLNKLLKAGKKVAICEQLENPKNAKGIVKRGLVRIITPGTVIEEDAIDSFDFNFIMGIKKEKDYYFIAISDTSTGDIFLTKSKELSEIYEKWHPKEIISDTKIDNYFINIINSPSNRKIIENEILTHFEVSTAKSIGITEQEFLYPLFYILKYIKRNLLDIALKKPVLLVPDNELHLDAIAVKTLELIETNEKNIDGSLFSVLNFCNTSMGERLLKRRILSPLRNISQIRKRLDIVEAFVNNFSSTKNLQKHLKNIYDIERIITRVIAKKSNARDLIWLKNSIADLPIIHKILQEFSHPLIKEFLHEFNTLEDIFKLIDSAIDENPPLTITEGGIIKKGYNKEIDELKNIKANSKQILINIELKEKEKTGIPTLKIKFNKVFGYYIEVSKTHTNKVPEYFERKQTLVNAERYITDELKELENKILSADEKLFKLEYEIFQEIRSIIETQKDRIRQTAEFIAKLDVYLSSAEAAVKYEYVKPVINNDEYIKVINARHPVIETKISEPFVPNDIFLDNSSNRLQIITGPNMAGKSTYIRMTALIVSMAQSGFFIPATEAEIGVVDRIFTRIGASDNLSKGESTFMVEMVETANILNNATDKSLVILDEIGRGTSTFDGVSIAWAVAEYLLQRNRSKTLFATHYHELTDIAAVNNGVKNYTIDVKEWNGEIIFLRKIVEGSSDRSYGIYVGELAGLPREVIARSKEILNKLEKNEFTLQSLTTIAEKTKKTEIIHQPMLIFEDNPAVEKIKNLDINNITPIEALNTLNQLKKMVSDE